MAEPSGPPQQATWLGWIPLPALVLAHHGSAVAVNERWADLSPVPAEGQGWLEAVEPVARPALRSMLRLAAATLVPGSTECPVAGPRGGRRSRWWWQPFPPGGLVVCVAVIDGGAAERLPLADDPAGRARELLDSVVNDIFTAGLSLQAATDLPRGAAAQRITEALRCLDEMVREVRDHVFAEQRQGTQPGHDRRPHTDAHERAELAANHTAMLRERVTRTAYALHLAAADTAAMLEQRGNLLGQPRRIDYPTEAKRWRALADQAKQMAERWEHPEEPATPQD